MGARDFDPDQLADAEFAGRVACYRRQWPPFLGAALRLVRVGFGLSWTGTLRGAWYLLRANQAWARYPDGRPERARACLRRFYALVARAGELRIDPAEAARLELESWRIHRGRQRAGEPAGDELTDALVALYSHLYAAGPESVREAARHRARAWGDLDGWMAGGQRDRPLLEHGHEQLRASYRALRSALPPPGS